MQQVEAKETLTTRILFGAFEALLAGILAGTPDLPREAFSTRHYAAGECTLTRNGGSQHREKLNILAGQSRFKEGLSQNGCATPLAGFDFCLLTSDEEFIPVHYVFFKG